MKKLLSPKIIISVVVVLVVVFMLGFVGYILFAPSTWWKPFYVKMEMDGGAEEAQAAAAPEAVAAASHEVAAPVAAPALGQPISAIRQPPGIMYQLDNKVVNLAEPGGLRYLQAGIVLELWPLSQEFYTLEGEELELARQEFETQVDARRPIIDDIVTTTLSSKTFNEISTIEGKLLLKEELIKGINDALGYQSVINIYFTSFVVQ